MIRKLVGVAVAFVVLVSACSSASPTVPEVKSVEEMIMKPLADDLAPRVGDAELSRETLYDMLSANNKGDIGYVIEFLTGFSEISANEGVDMIDAVPFVLAFCEGVTEAETMTELRKIPRQMDLTLGGTGERTTVDISVGLVLMSGYCPTQVARMIAAGIVDGL